MTEMPRLSADLAGPKAPDRCQSCGGGATLFRWQEHDERDRPERTVFVLCRACSNRLVEPHPRLYREMDPNEPWAGCMPICLDCPHRRDVRCGHPEAKLNGGPGLILKVPSPTRVHLHRSPRRLSGWTTIWRGPVRACQGKETVGA